MKAPHSRQIREHPIEEIRRPASPTCTKIRQPRSRFLFRVFLEHLLRGVQSLRPEREARWWSTLQELDSDVGLADAMPANLLM